MYPFRADLRVIVPGAIVPRVDTAGIYVLATTGKVTTADESLDYGINPCQWAALPNEGLMVWKVRHPAAASEVSLPVNVVIPSSGISTVNSPNTTTGTTKVPIVDNKGTQVVGSDVTNPASGEASPAGSYTEHIVWFNKCAGIFRLLGVKAQDSSAASASAPAQANAKSK